VFANQLAVLELRGRTARLAWHTVAPGQTDLRCVSEHALS
jgi:hypothetical protein